MTHMHISGSHFTLQQLLLLSSDGLFGVLHSLLLFVGLF